jgi:hypothetical protein
MGTIFQAKIKENLASPITCLQTLLDGFSQKSAVQAGLHYHGLMCVVTSLFMSQN